MISVIIPAFNEEELIKNSLQSLANQNYKKDFEIVVVNNNSNDNTVGVFNDFKKSLPAKKKSKFRIIDENRQGRGNARATGVEQSNGDLIAFIDADSTAPENWLSIIDEIFKEEKVVATTGPWRAVGVGSFSRWFLNNFQEVFHQIPYFMFRGHFCLNGMNMVLRKSAYEKTSGFDRDLNAHEDIDMAEKISKIGKIVYSKKLKVTIVARRFKNGLVVGFWDYIKPFVEKFIFGKRNIELKDRR